jgi:hypothetical protein
MGGSIMASTINAKNTSTGVVITPDSSGQLELQTADTTRMTITSSGNVGIGVTPSAWVNSSLEMAPSSFIGGAGTVFTISTNGVFGAGATWTYKTTNLACAYAQDTGQHIWYQAASGTAGTNISFIERMRLNTSGQLLYGLASSGASNAVAQFYTSTATNCLSARVSNNGQAPFAAYNASDAVIFYVSGGGQIFAVSTSISAISDISTKENIVDLPYGLNEINSLRPVKFDFKENSIGDGKTDNLGFIAQEVEPIIPELVADSADGLKTLKMGDMLPILVKAIQEQQAIINDLKARIETLEGASA